ncbi:MAG TPA: PEP/pyruvate-binding domain-containing protein [Sandaracinaceae bacterium LLY-WYZ-13_1]|nr:PEP/pyruvate-binding domain-containing protein [Sandaracinaceae bacterium LLY-WYZ-13_1]
MTQAAGPDARLTGAMRWLVLITLLSATACGGSTSVQRARRSTSEASEARPRSTARLAHAHRIDDAETWARLAARPRTASVARTEVVKLLIDLEDERRLWFVDTERWPVHYDFARERLSSDARPVEDHATFNVAQYRRTDRRFVMGSVVHYLDPDLWTFEMIAGDDLAGARVLRAFEQVRDAVYFGEALRYRPVSALHEERTATVGERLPRIGADEVFASIRYQPLTEGVAYGTLRFVRGALDPSTVRPSEILVLAELPDEIPVSAGVVSAQLQAPLGHLAILCATRRTPNMGLRGALDDPRLIALEGRLVRLEVGPQEPSIRAATRREAEAAWASRRPEQPLTPRLDDRDVGLRAICDLRIGDADTVGAKAAQLGEVCAIGGVVRTPGGFAVPFHDYLHHLGRAGAADGIDAMLADGSFRRDAGARAERLAELRAIVERAPVDRALIRRVRRRIARFDGEPRVIFRSSTNAEDLPGFTGAGLYRSTVVPSDASDEAIADALRHVWASVWLQGAHEEREWYRIDHARVAMGVIVQPFVDGAVANGVAITRNPFYEARPAYFVNAQALGGTVTGAGGDEIPEQHLIYTYGEELEAELLSRSTRTAGQPLLGEAELAELAEVLGVLHERMLPHWAHRANAVDVEFLIAGPDRHVVVLQARPFQVAYAEGQRWQD